MKNNLLKVLQKFGPLCVEDISDALMWEEALVHSFLVPLVSKGEVHMEIDGTYWISTELERMGVKP